jgi:TonB family protein
MRKLGFLALAAALPATIAAATGAMSPPWFAMQMADYPADALAARQEGDVPITLHIRADGTIESCAVDSGPKLLRRASCAIVAARGLFGPSTDKHGTPVAKIIKAIARWSIPTVPPVADFGGATPISQTSWFTPADYPYAALKAGQSGVVDIAFEINENGRVTSCTIVKSSRSSTLDSTTCDLFKARAGFLAAVDETGAPRATRGHDRFHWTM